jgi:vacuole morphology and inheritance protein 14
VERNQYLFRALYGLLMILPQSEAFIMLKNRLDCVPSYYNRLSVDPSSKPANDDKNGIVLPSSSKIDFKQLLEHFVQIQEKQRFFKLHKRINAQ